MALCFFMICTGIALLLSFVAAWVISGCLTILFSAVRRALEGVREHSSSKQTSSSPTPTDTLSGDGKR